jgi:hypothetical protein
MRFVLSETSGAVDSLHGNPVSRKLELMDIAHSSFQVTIMEIPFMALCKVDFIIGQCGYKFKCVNRETTRIERLLSSWVPLALSSDFPHNKHATVRLHK